MQKFFILFICFTYIAATDARAANTGFAHFNGTTHYFQDTTKPKDTIKYPLKDRRGDYISSPNRNPFYLSDTSFIDRKFEYDVATDSYYLMEKIGNKYYRAPVAYTREEMVAMLGRRDEVDYFRQRSQMFSDLNRQMFRPKFTLSSKDWFNKLMGNGKVEIKPTGFVEMFAGYQGQKTQNPTLPERARNNGGPDFDLNTQFQMDANIGDKLKLPINYNTMAQFGQLDNKLNLNYKGQDDQILKEFQLGNINFTSRSQLIPGAQSLFGARTRLQFGRLFVTGLIANQRSERSQLNMQGGSGNEKFRIKADEYEENRHFLLAQYFRNNYNKAMSTIPLVQSQVRIMRMEVWVTNRNGVTTETRDVVGLMDLGEGNPYLGPPGDPNALPDNNTNDLYRRLKGNTAARSSSSTQSALTSMGLTAVQDYEKTFARKLNPSEYYYNPQIGFLSLSTPLFADEVLGVAFQYTYRGRVYQVGEFSQDVPPDSTATSQNVLFLKLLKATSQRTALPLWDLMMKNVYSVGYGQLDSTDFKVDVVYEEPSKGTKRFLPPEDVRADYQGKPLITLLNLDRLNNQKDPQPDGIYDFVDGFTVIPSMSRLIFPVLEPFGHDLDYLYDTDEQRRKYLFYPLYDTIKAIAQTYSQLNRFELHGRSKTYQSSDGQIYMGSFNIPRGSVRVTANGQYLQEGTDYEVNYDQGTVRVTNQAIINSGVPVDVQFENQSLTSAMLQRNYMALRLDYLLNKKLTLGGTVVRLGERPFFVKTNYGEDPIRNTMYGVDASYESEWPRLTKWLDKLPNYSTKAMSSINAFAEAAVLDPGHPKQIGKGTAGQSYLDDFEGTRSNIPLAFPLISWNLSAVPQNDLFPESSLHNNLESGYRRSKLAWYNIEPVLQDATNNNNPLKQNHSNLIEELSKPETRQVMRSEVFPQQSVEFGQGILTTFDLAYYPAEKGPYNFEYRQGKIDITGKLIEKNKSWAGITRGIDQNTDFETANVEFVEFWLQDPFISKPSSRGGKFYINLGNISEDILKDGKRQYENGLPTPKINAKVDTSTVWGQVPANPMQITNGFSIDPDDREYQDVGFDGLTDVAERIKFATYLNNLVVTAPQAFQAAQADPSGDNFKPYRDASYDAAKAGILERYKNINNPSGNSPVSNNSQFVTAATQYPDSEELNRDNTLTEQEEYFEYELDIKPFMNVGTNFITDVREVPVALPNGQRRTEKWYLFRVPIAQYTRKIGKIPDFKSIRFMRMYLTNFEDSVVMRFGKLELIRNQWRKFQNEIDTTGAFVSLPANDPVEVNTLAVNLEENDQRTPVKYIIPPGIERQQQLGSNNVQLAMNEQSLGMQVCGLPFGESRGVFKSMNVDMRQYGKLMMFVHAEGKGSDNAIFDGALSAVVRIANDYQGNYYEIKIPLKKTPWGATDTTAIWPEANNLDFDLNILTKLKQSRNTSGWPSNQYYKEITDDGRTYAIMGNPNLGEVRGILLAVENTNMETACAEVWFNELRFGRLDERGGYAATGRVDITLADLGTISGSASIKSAGFGTLENRVQNRFREDLLNLDISANLDFGKLLPKNWGMVIPFYGSLSKIISTPEYDPYDMDIYLRDKLNSFADKAARDSMKYIAQDVMTIKTFNFTNVKKAPAPDSKPRLWNVSNFDLSYSYLSSKQHNPLLENDELTRQRFALGYNFTPQARTFEPFKKIRNKTPWLALVRDFNINYVPSQISFKADIFRQMGATLPRNVDEDKTYPMLETYNKYFTFDRYYIVRWDLTKALSIDYSATNLARIDEPSGRIDEKWKKDSIRKNLFSGGRTTDFMQKATASYNLPLQKIPALDWVNVRLEYSALYNWKAVSLLARQLGNTLGNGQTRNLTGEFNFEQLYNKSRFLRAATSPNPLDRKTAMQEKKIRDSIAAMQKIGQKASGKKTGQNVHDTVWAKLSNREKGVFVKEMWKKARVEKWLDDKDKITELAWIQMTYKEKRKYKKQVRIKSREIKRLKRQQKRDARNAIVPYVSPAARAGVGLLTSVKRVGVQITEEMGTILPSYTDSTQFMGANLRSGEPGWNFIFGYQPDTSWINKFGRKGKLSTDSLVTAMIEQRLNQTINITAQVQPFRDFNIDLNLRKTFNKNYSETYKDTLGTGINGLARLNPYAAGSFDITFIAFKTSFHKVDADLPSETFKRFEANRAILSKRLASLNGYQGGAIDPKDPSFYKGYGRYAQDVIIPSFIAAYTGKSPDEVGLVKSSNRNLRDNPFSAYLPRPNWGVVYNGLNRVPAMQKVFTNFSIRHGYHTTLQMNSFNSALMFWDPFHWSMPGFIDTATSNYVPFYLVPNITITESFDPVVEVDMTFTNQLSTKVSYSKRRMLTLSLIDYQLAQQISSDIQFTFSWRKKGVPFLQNVTIGKRGLKLDNDITFNCNLGFRDDVTTNSKLDQGTSIPTMGQKMIKIEPSIDYILNKRVRLKFFFDQMISTPKISNAFPTTNTRAGVNIRVALDN